jgi:hypothetical protein
MSIHTLAKHVQQKGRGNDKMLVHMTPNEVHGLQALAKLHGGSLTTNPETGLPEAGFLEQVLPIVAMAAATYFTAGAAAPALSAAFGSSMAGGIAAGSLAGAGVGAIGAAAQDKDVGQGALYGGIGGAISGGMGAYGDANVLSGATPTPSPDVVNQVALDASVTGQIPGESGAALTPVQQSAMDPNAGLAGTTPGMPPSGAPIPPTAEGNAAAAQNLSQQQRVEALNKLAEAKGAGVTSNAYGSTPGPNAEQSLYQTQNAGKFGPEGNIYSDLKATPPPPGSEPSYYSTITTPGGKLATQALPGIGADIGMNEQSFQSPTEDNSSQSTLSADFQGYTPRQPKPYYQAQYTRYAADGGLMALAGGGSAEEKKKKQRATLTADRTMAAMSADQAGLAMLNNARYGANMAGASPLSSMTLGDLPSVAGAGGGLADLGGYSDGGRLLKGPGDGMSDNIPAQIGRKQPARLADGEFVVPADVVSHLGNGSTDAGAKRLYAMMDKVRQARTGKKKQAPAINYKQGVPV